MNRQLMVFTLMLASFFMGSLSVSAETECEHEVRTLAVPDPVSGREYEIMVSLPDGFSENPQFKRPVLVLADGGRAFPSLACIGRTLARQNDIAIDPVIVGLSYALGEDWENSRRRDYTPVQRAGSSLAYGEAAAYTTYIHDVVLARVEAEFHTAPTQRIYWGHSYGGLLGSYMLLTQPTLFQTWLIGSPSFWYEKGAIYAFEETYAQDNKNLDARVLFYVGGLELSRYDSARDGYTRDMVAGMQDFMTRLQAREYADLSMISTVLNGMDHRTAVKPGFEWAIRTAFPVAEK